MNFFKTVFLMTLLTLLFLAVGHLLGGQQGMIIAFVFALASNALAYWFSDKLVLMMYRAQALDEAENNKRIFAIVRNLTQKSGLPMPKLYMIPMEAPNAFATGRNPKHAAIAVTHGILKLLNDSELEGVLAHELAHVQNRDILTSTIVATFAGAIYMLAHMARWAAIFGGGRGRREGGAINLVAFLILIIVAPLCATLIQLAISRAREYGADETGARLHGQPLTLANALRKLHSYAERSPVEVNPTTAHLFIVNPLSGRAILNLFSTHPPLEKRIERLEKLAVGGLP